ncbi:MAG: 3-hydroxyacyl-[acyl-carrier-protein] dehydratase FabZ, partial [Ilumatobacteraceae bacterium]
CTFGAQLKQLLELESAAMQALAEAVGGIDKARFRRQVVPGDELVLECSMTRLAARAGRGSGRALVGGEVATECDLMFVIA